MISASSTTSPSGTTGTSSTRRLSDLFRRHIEDDQFVPDDSEDTELVNEYIMSIDDDDDLSNDHEWNLNNEYEWDDI